MLAPLEDTERLVYRPPGYLLAVDDDELDATQFTRLVRQARGHASAGDHASRLEVFEAALALWRGEILAEFDGVHLEVDPEIARLADLRLAAAEGHAEAMLHLGRGAEVVAELAELVRRFPEREPPAAR